MSLANSLFSAILNNNLARVEKLLNSDIEVNVRNSLEKTPLHIAVVNPGIVKLLIEKGADVNAANSNGDTPLHAAVDLIELETVCMLLYYNADPNVANKNNETPFMKALMSGFVQLQRPLLQYIDDFSNEPNIVAVAIKYGSPHVREIVSKGGPIDQRAVKYFNFSDDNLELFKFIWPRVPGSEINEKTIGPVLIFKLCRGSTSKNFGKYLDFLIEHTESTVVDAIAHSLSDVTLKYFYLKCYSFNCLKELTKFFCLLLQHNFKCSPREKILIFEIFGYCSLFRILLYFDIEGEEGYYKSACSFSTILPVYIYFIRTDIKSICDNIDFRDAPFPKFKCIVNTMSYWAHPRLVSLLNNLQIIRFPKFTELYPELPAFPSLVELARDKSREYLVDKFEITNSGQYYTLVYHLHIPADCMDILAFRKKIYRIKF
ncbi:unnamed protein product [Phyllotreta striolata]|uniref:Ankyrin repeat protein n=1 Tax=Phyllotreta striolata TaxID=444603 RepID=A0A9N9TT52_PHYSR|nr:unnamed protein product [Phyllotreta striolata]